MDDKKWSDFYSSDRKNINNIFVKVMTSDEKHFFFHDYNEWLNIKEHCEKNSVIVQDLHLQFRSNKCIIDIPQKIIGIYLVRSVLGSIGQPTKNYFTVGFLKKDGLVYKQMWLTPEMILDKEYTDEVSQCFEEALIRYEQAAKIGKEQV